MKKFRYLILALVFAGCEKELPTAQKFPVLATLAVGSIDETGVTFRAELLQKGETETTSYGFVWDVENPTIETSNSVILGTTVGQGIFEKRINYSISKGLTYSVRAFATFSNTTVYGNAVMFESKGSDRTPWSLDVTGAALGGYFTSHGSSDNANGFVLFQSSELYTFDPATNKFSPGNKFPVGGNSGTQFCSVLANNVQYFFSSNNNNLYRLQSGTWSVESGVPFNFGIFSGYYHGHSSAGKIYVLSSYVSYMYDPADNSWSGRSSLPINAGYSIGGVSLGAKAYVITTDKNVWEYDPTGDSWTIKTTYPGRLEERIISFADEDKIYFGLSFHDHYEENNWMDTEFWSYDPARNLWELQELFPANLTSGDVFFFTLDNKLYIGHGFQTYNLWVFDPSV